MQVPHNALRMIKGVHMPLYGTVQHTHTHRSMRNNQSGPWILSIRLTVRFTCQALYRIKKRFSHQLALHAKAVVKLGREMLRRPIMKAGNDVSMSVLSLVPGSRRR